MSEFIGYTDLPIENLSEDKFNVGQYIEGQRKNKRDENDSKQIGRKNFADMV